MGTLPRKDVQVNDLLDAFAAPWTAERIARGKAETLPPVPPRDPVGLRMEIVF
jgi:predicted RNase H-like nuclease